jgi:hypothetical protein
VGKPSSFAFALSEGRGADKAGAAFLPQAVAAAADGDDLAVVQEPVARMACHFAWNRDPATGLMCVQSGPRRGGSRLASDTVGGFDWDAGCGDDRQNTPGVLFAGEGDQGDLPRAADSRKVVRKVIRTGTTEFRSERSRQPMPQLGAWREQLEASLEANAQKPLRDRLTLVRIFEDMQGLGFDGGYAAVRRYAARWREKHSSAPSTAYIPLTFAPGKPASSIHMGPFWSRAFVAVLAVGRGCVGHQFRWERRVLIFRAV